MELDLLKLKETLENLRSSIAYLDEINRDFRKVTLTVHPIQREIKEQEKFIDSQKGKYSDNIIAKLVEKKEVLNQKLQLIYEVELLFNQANDDLCDFVQKYSLRQEKLKKYSDLEIATLYNLYLISQKTNLSHCRKELYSYSLKITDCDLTELVNSQFQLTGLNRFYLEDNIVRSYYCNDLKFALSFILSKNRFYVIKMIVNKNRKSDIDLISPLKLLHLIVSNINKRNAIFQIPYDIQIKQRNPYNDPQTYTPKT